MSSLVSVTIDSGIAIITMDDGKANVFSHAMWDELEAAFDQAETAKAIVVLKGREGIFSGGFDLKEMG
ncbi:MAG: enoyl-CoA hydratase, partial [Oceanospirillaceae bacterium]